MKIRLKFLKRFINWVGEQFEKLSPKLKKAVTAGVQVTEAIKKIVDNPSLNFLTELTNTDLDDKAVAKVRQVLPSIFKTLGLLKEAEGKEGEVFFEVFAELITKTDNEKAIFWHSFSVELTKVMSDGELSQADIIYLTQWYYDHRVKTDLPNK